ncbi:hypothetical protein EDB19DRAFT_1958795 [Suillus lakei]|nr:hypothetical protein EDB19DRAFT_1958795 [Suillus lakei]
MIDNSEMLQNTVDLGYLQMISVGSSETVVPPATRRTRLRQYDAAWRRFEYKQKYSLPLFESMLGSIRGPVGGIYGSGGEDCIHFARLSSASESADLRCWSHPVDGTDLVDLAFCPAQDLLIVVTSPPGIQGHEFDIHLRSLTTNDVHPDAAQSILKALDKDNVDHARLPSVLKVQILGNYVTMLRRTLQTTENRDMVGDYLQMWDWKSKNGYQPPQCTAKISLPSLMDDFSYTDAHTNENPTPGSMFPYSQKSCRQPSCLFHPSTDDQLITIVVSVFRDTNVNDFHLHRFFTRRSALLEFESLFSKTYGGQPTSNGPKLPWSMWGPQHTTWFRVRYIDSEPSLYGFRTVHSIGESESAFPVESRRLCIRDFNPHLAWNYGAEDKFVWRGLLVQGEVTRTISPQFAEPLGSALTYRGVVSEELFDVAETLMDDSGILLSKIDGSEDLQNIDVLVF